MVLTSVNGANRIGCAHSYTPAYTLGTGINGMSNRLNGANRINGIDFSGLGYTQADIDAFELAYAVGDPDAVNGVHGQLEGIGKWLKKRKAKRQVKKSDRNTRKATRRAVRMEKLTTGGRFIDKVGDLASGLAAKFKNEGIDPDPELMQELEDSGELDNLNANYKAGSGSEEEGGGNNKMIMYAIAALVAAKLFKVF